MKQHEWTIVQEVPKKGETYYGCEWCSCRKLEYRKGTIYFPDKNKTRYTEPDCIERPETKPDPSGPYAMGPGH